MPPVAAAAAGAAVAKGVGAAIGAKVLGSTFLASSIVALAGAAASSLVGGLFAPSGRGQTLPSLSQQDQGIQFTSRKPDLPHKIVYGTRRLAGNIVFVETSEVGFKKTTTTSKALEDTNKPNRYLHMIQTFAGHEVNDITEVWIEDEVVTLDADGYATDSKYTKDGRYVFRAVKYLGTDSQTADADLIAALPTKWDSNRRLRGITYLYIQMYYDADAFPQGIPTIRATIEGKKVFDPRDSSTSFSNNAALCIRDYLVSEYGFDADSTEIDDTLFQSAANICDEDVPLAVGGTQKRYTCDAVIDTGNQLIDNAYILSNSIGGAIIYSQGKLGCVAGSFTTPSVTIDESWLAGDITVQTKQPQRKLFNTIKGTYVDPDRQWQVVNFPTVEDSTAVTEDGKTIEESIELPVITDSIRAQRIAKIALEKNRQGITATLPLNMKGLQLRVFDTVYITNDLLGWSSKPFRILTWENKDFGANITVQEDDASVYAWTTEETALPTVPDTNLPDPFTVPPVGVFGLSSIPVETAGGDIVYKIGMSWTASTDPFVLSGGQYQIQYKLSTDTEYTGNQRLDGSATETELIQSQIDVLYDIRIRAINSIGVKSAYTTVTGFKAGSTLVADREDWEFETLARDGDDWENDTLTSEDWE